MEHKAFLQNIQLHFLLLTIQQQINTVLITSKGKIASNSLNRSTYRRYSLFFLIILIITLSFVIIRQILSHTICSNPAVETN